MDQWDLEEWDQWVNRVDLWEAQTVRWEAQVDQWEAQVDQWEAQVGQWEAQVDQWVDLVVQWVVEVPLFHPNNLNINLPQLNNNNNKIYKNRQLPPTPPTLSHHTHPAQFLRLLI